jgi:hypothetical protein
VAEFAAGGDPELGENLAHVPFHGASAEKQLGRNLGVGVAIASEARDKRFLIGENADGFDGAFEDAFAGGLQFAASTFGEGLNTNRG